MVYNRVFGTAQELRVTQSPGLHSIALFPNEDKDIDKEDHLVQEANDSDEICEGGKTVETEWGPFRTWASSIW